MYIANTSGSLCHHWIKIELGLYQEEIMEIDEQDEDDMIMDTEWIFCMCVTLHTSLYVISNVSSFSATSEQMRNISLTYSAIVIGRSILWDVVEYI